MCLYEKSRLCLDRYATLSCFVPMMLSSESGSGYSFSYNRGLTRARKLSLYIITISPEENRPTSLA